MAIRLNFKSTLNKNVGKSFLSRYCFNISFTLFWLILICSLFQTLLIFKGNKSEQYGSDIISKMDIPTAIVATKTLKSESESESVGVAVKLKNKSIINRSSKDNTGSKNISSSSSSSSSSKVWRDYNASEMSDGNLMIEFFTNGDNDDDKNKDSTIHTEALGFSACLFNLEDTIRLVEWIPYHYTVLPLTSLVIAIDPNTSERGLNRTLELIELWKTKINITLWPSFFLPKPQRYQPKRPLHKERQVYFVNQCLKYHSTFKERSWTLLTDNDEYILYNYPHKTETIEDKSHTSYDEKIVQERIYSNRKKYMHWRYSNVTNNENNITDENENNNNTEHKLPMKLNQTIFNFIQQNNNILKLPTCVSIPGITYGGGDLDFYDPKLSSYSTSLFPLPWLSLSSSSTSHNNDYKNDNGIDTIIDPNILSTYRYIYHEKYTSRFSKVMIDISRLKTLTLEWSNKHAQTIHNPSAVCGYNGRWDSGADYYSSIFRLNHYIGSKESFLERQGDFRSRTIELYNKKFENINTTKDPLFYDHDILPWIDLFINKLDNNITKLKQLLFQPLEKYVHCNGTGTE